MSTPSPPPSSLFSLPHIPAKKLKALPWPIVAVMAGAETGVEVADRLAAKPGSKVYGVPSVKAAWYADVRRAGSIGRNVFWPAPQVDSGLVAWTHRDPPVTDIPRERVFAVIDAAFAQRRKGLRGALRELAGSTEAAQAALERAGLDPLARGESLGIGQFVRIAEELQVDAAGTPNRGEGGSR